MSPETQEKSPEEKAVEEIGYSLEAMKICVSGITDRTTQRKPRNKQRNKTLCKVVKGKGDEGNWICESDEFVFNVRCDYNSRDFRGSEWFPKRDQRPKTVWTLTTTKTYSPSLGKS